VVREDVTPPATARPTEAAMRAEKADVLNGMDPSGTVIQ
jgi:hypothetical protein